MASLVLKKSRHGRGVFANRDFKKNEFIIQFRGKMVSYGQFPQYYVKIEDHCVQIGKRLYMGPSGDIDDFLNHSCSPNSGLKINGKKAALTAIRGIKKGEEIVWDYSTTMDEDCWEIDCRCGSRNCRKMVRDFKHLDEKTKQKYVKLGIVPKYILKKYLRS